MSVQTHSDVSDKLCAMNKALDMRDALRALEPLINQRCAELGTTFNRNPTERNHDRYDLWLTALLLVESALKDAGSPPEPAATNVIPFTVRVQ
jgi:hypothetical protein